MPFTARTVGFRHNTANANISLRPLRVPAHAYDSCTTLTSAVRRLRLSGWPQVTHVQLQGDT